jgi:hypothetical protein
VNLPRGPHFWDGIDNARLLVLVLHGDRVWRVTMKLSVEICIIRIWPLNGLGTVLLWHLGKSNEGKKKSEAG